MLRKTEAEARALQIAPCLREGRCAGSKRAHNDSMNPPSFAKKKVLRNGHAIKVGA